MNSLSWPLELLCLSQRFWEGAISVTVGIISRPPRVRLKQGKEQNLSPCWVLRLWVGWKGGDLVLTWRYMIWTEVVFRGKSTWTDRFRHNGCLNHGRCGGGRKAACKQVVRSQSTRMKGPQRKWNLYPEWKCQLSDMLKCKTNLY